jgi:hypothetical protein
VDLVFLFGSRRFSQLSVSSFAQPMSLHSNDCRHTVVNELPLRSRIPNENSDEHGMGQEDGLATSRRDTALIAAICAAPAKGAPRKRPENCLKIAENEVLHGSPIWDFLSTGKKACLRPIFTSRPENRDRVSNSSLECRGLVIHAARSGFFFLGHLSHQCFCGKHESGDRGGVLQRVPGHFRRVDHACFH